MLLISIILVIFGCKILTFCYTHGIRDKIENSIGFGLIVAGVIFALVIVNIYLDVEVR